MTYADTLLPEFDQEMANTRKVLERLLDDKLDWQPYPKSHTIGWNANHVAEIPNWMEAVLTTPTLDIASIGGEPYASPQLTSGKEILVSPVQYFLQLPKETGSEHPGDLVT